MNKSFKVVFNNYPVTAYIVLAGGIIWLCWIIAIFASDKMGYGLPALDQYILLILSGFASVPHILISLIFILGGFAPLIAAIIIVRCVSGKPEMGELWRRIFRFRIGLN